MPVVLALLLSLIALALSLLAWFGTTPRVSSLEAEATRRLHSIEQRIDEMQTNQERISAGLRDLVDRAKVLEQRAADAAGMQEQIEKLYRNLSEDSTEVLLAEVESLLVLANQQLALGLGSRRALVALQEIEARLGRADDARLQSLRTAVQHDIERIRAYPSTDPASVATRIDAVMRSVDRLPLLSSVDERKSETRPPAHGLEALRDELEQLFRVRRIDAPDAMLLAPEQGYFLRENLKLLLLQARMSASTRNEKLFRSDLEQAIGWLQKYFVTDDRGVTTALTQLQQLASAPISLEPPTLDESLAAVRAARAALTSRNGAR